MATISLESYEKTVFECLLNAAKIMKTIAVMLEVCETPEVADGVQTNKPIPLPNEAVTDRVLKKIIEWVEYHYDDPQPDDEFDEHKDKRNEELSHWDKNFINVGDLNVDDNRAFLFDIIDAANYLDIKGLLEVGAKHICNQIKGKTCVEVRKILNISEGILTKEQEEAIHKENEWIHAKD